MSIWPNSMDVVATSFEYVTDDVERYKLVRENRMTLYGLPLRSNYAPHALQPQRR